MGLANQAIPASRPQAQIDAVKTGLSVAAGIAAAGALMLAVRRQRLAEIAHLSQDHDAAEKRKNEMYVKAVEQIASERPQVRMAGFYALEQLGQNNPEVRQMVVDVICAYLRMPFVPPPEAYRIPYWARDAANDLALMSLEGRLDEAHQARFEEWQVRMLAQEILDHKTLKYGDPVPDSYWPGLSLNLTDAVLVNWHFGGGHIEHGNFSGATFIGRCFLDNTTFTGQAWFRGAVFVGPTSFFRSVFEFTADFHDAEFKQDAHFVEAEFARKPDFKGTIFAKTPVALRAKLADVVVEDGIFEKNAADARHMISNDSKRPGD
ncbi:hypothetical protein AFR_34040 [Actinoplanes friuliensis DSM 7358]|uniref:Pentapeptide repeat-containing protein n=2 Tax=Actinoplanes friuliensis TaxID=196914 RepID=U5WAW5_9ACTN|nr:hypothetical protein AFR_34040 [Actinoplanes friuliensis DSM 7358]